MSNLIESEINKYQTRFPLLNREAIIDEMFKDGIFDKMLKTGEIKQSDIEMLKTGDVTITLKGAKKTYKISYDEIKQSNHLSGGDADMRALEFALDKYIRELAYDKKVMASQVDIQGNTTYYLYQVLFGNGKDFGKYKPDMNKDFNDPNKSFCIGAGMFDAPYSETIDAILDSKGKPVDFVTGHAYAVVKADEKYVYLINPWDSKETLKIEHARLERLRPNVGVCNY